MQDKFLLLLFLSVLLFGANGCAPQYHSSTPKPPANIPILASGDNDGGIAIFLGTAVEGESRLFNSSCLGQNIRITAGKTYLSAYGLQCREGFVQGMRRVAACQQLKSGKDVAGGEFWLLAPDIMDSGQN